MRISKHILLRGSLPLVAQAACAATAVKPNIVFIMCADMGYGDLHCYGQPYIQTPNIDRMAQEGMRFTQAYAGAPVSAPSRASLMTGQHTGHTLVRGNKEYWPNMPMVNYGQNQDYSRVGQMPYDSTHIILPEVMKAGGYRTALFGKWAGGYEGSCSTPDKRGIDEFYGYICQFQAHLYYPNFLNEYSSSRGDTAVSRVILQENIQWPMSGEGYFHRHQYSADLIHRKALEWLDRQDDKHPFVGFFTYTLPHAELAQPNDSILRQYKRQFFVDKTWGGQPDSRYNAVEHTHAQFAAMITRLDKYVGEIMEELRLKHLDRNTIVIFTSYNGPHEEGGADPVFFGRDGKLRGLKRQCYEGGIRIPFIVWWPGHIKAGSVSNHQLAFYDVMPTFCELAHLPLPPKGNGKTAVWKTKQRKTDYLDGISFAPTLLGQSGQQQHPWLYWEFSETDQMALRMGNWKMVVVKGLPQLYNLATDLHEDRNVAEQHPDIVREMVGIILSQHRESKDFEVTLPNK